MFNSKYKKEALRELERASSKYQSAFDEAVKNTSILQERRMAAIETLKQVERYVDELRNKPYEFEKIIREIKIRRQNFESKVESLRLESQHIDRVAGTTAGAGALAGAGVAALGPTAAMGIAMTFGTASTGTAIATLSGAAATNAALAWLGGGALLAGGGGMVAGETFLALLGPVGWIIGGSALTLSGVFATKKNREIAENAESSTRVVKKETTRIQKVSCEVERLSDLTRSLSEKITVALNKIRDKNDYRYFTVYDKENMRIIMNSSESLSQQIGVTIS